MRATTVLACFPLIGSCIGTETDSPDAGDATTDSDADADVDSDADSDFDEPDTDSPGDTDTTPTAYDVCASGAPFTSIQDAVDAASDGDVIDICPGTYEAVDIVGVDVDLRGDDRDTTTIDGGEFYVAVRVENAIVGLSGLTMTGSPVTFGSVGALDVSNGATVTVTDAAIRDVAGELATHAARSTNSDLWFEDVVFEDNLSDGGAIYQAVGGSVTMTHCVLRANGVGPMLNLVSLDVTFTNNLVYDNETIGYAISVSFDDFMADHLQVVMNNTIAENEFEYFAVAAFGPTIFSGNIVADNNSAVGIAVTGPDYSLSWGHDDNFSSILPLGVGTLEEPPIFNNADAADFTLDPVFSPCVDAGDPDAVWNDTDGTRNDMGAFGGPGGDWTPPS